MNSPFTFWHQPRQTQVEVVSGLVSVLWSGRLLSRILPPHATEPSPTGLPEPAMFRYAAPLNVGGVHLA